MLFEGVRFYKEAMDALYRLPPTEKNKREQIELVIAFHMPVRRIGYSEEYLAVLQKTVTLAEEIGDDKNRMQLQGIMGVYHILKGNDPERGWKYLEKCMVHPEIIQDTESMISIGCDLCLSCCLSGDWSRISRVAPGIINLIENCQKQGKFFGAKKYPWIIAFLGLSRAMSGDFDTGQQMYEKALTLALDTKHQGTLGIVEWGYGGFLILKGDGDGAARHLRNAVKHLEESQSVVMLGPVWAILGFAHCLIGRPEIGADMAEKGLKMHTDLGIPFWRSFCHWYCCLAHFELGNMEHARKHVEFALHFSIENNEKLVQGLSMVWLGRVTAKIDPMHIDDALQQIIKGMSLFNELGLTAYYSMGNLWLGEVYAEAGRHEAALKTLKTAETMFWEMGMDCYWLGKAKEALAGLLI